MFQEFKPPKPNALVEFVGDHVCLPLAKWWGYYDQIEIGQECLRKLRRLSGNRVVLCPNHSHPHDSIVVYALSRALGQRFFYIAAREVFDNWRKFQGWLIQRLGAYSVRRGRLDRKSMHTTLAILAQSARKLVVFAEGEISGRNDRVLPVQTGLMSVFVQAAASAREALYIVPLVLRYTYTHDIGKSLNNVLVRIERTLQLPHQGSLSERFHRAREVVLDKICRERAISSEQLPELFEKGGQLARACALLSFRDDYRLCQDNLAAGVDLIERELYGKVTQKGRRRAVVVAGEAININALLQTADDRRTAAVRLSQAIHAQWLYYLTGDDSKNQTIAA